MLERMLQPFRVVIAGLVFAGCTKEAPPAKPVMVQVEGWKTVPTPSGPAKIDPEGSAEAAYRQFMLANLEGTEAKIRPLIIDRPGSETLWRGPYPSDVAEMLAAQYRTMDIVRISETPTKVTLGSSAARVPMEVVLEGTQWKIDPAPIIQFRKATAQ